MEPPDYLLKYDYFSWCKILVAPFLKCSMTICIDSCIELRRVEMEEHRLRMEEANQGYILRQEFVKTGQAKKAERLVSLLVHFL